MNKKSHIVLIVIFIFLFGWNAYGEGIDKSKANKVKAALIYNMIKMTSWPASSFTDNDPLFILFLGKDYNEIGSYFDAQVRSRSLSVKERKLAVKELAATELNDAVRKELKRCHVLFIMSTYKGPVMELLHAVENKSVLVIGESSSFPLEGGMIGLSVQKKRVGISVNLDAVKNTDLKISAQLLQHAKIVKSER